MRYFVLFCLFLMGCAKVEEAPYVPQPSPEQFVGRVVLPSLSIRLLVLKHCPDDIADTDSNEAIEAANLASQKGLTIRDIGNFHINKDGQTESKLVFHKLRFGLDDLAGLKSFISEQMKQDAQPGDTLVIYTIGHGGQDGVMRLGKRDQLMRIIAAAAEENNQETFWWQLSCHAAGGLPPIASLTQRQQELFAMSASSPANKLSYFCTQGDQMEKVFCAIADRSIDIDQDDVVTAGELKTFMIREYGQTRGNLIFARQDDEPIFGRLMNRIPIVNLLNPKMVIPVEFIPVL